MENIAYFLSKLDSATKEALSLVEKEYIKQGYLNPKNSNCKIAVLPGSATFIAKINDKIVGTVSVIFDSPSGLPMDEIYKKEVDKLRLKNKKIVEVGRLAVAREFLSKKSGFSEKYNNLSLVSSLFKLVFHYCIYKNIDNICISINPKHNLFYKSICFEDIGGLKFYPSVNNAPALAKTFDINKIKNKKIKNYFLLKKIFIDNPPNYKLLR